MSNEHEDKKPHECYEIQYFVDDEPEHTTHEVLSAGEVLRRAGLNADDYYLKRVSPSQSYENSPDAEVKIHLGDRFISVARLPTPVS